MTKVTYSVPNIIVHALRPHHPDRSGRRKGVQSVKADAATKRSRSSSTPRPARKRSRRLWPRSITPSQRKSIAGRSRLRPLHLLVRSMSETKQLTLPITGMTCANCVATVERNLKKLDGVETAVVNLSSERATVEFDPAEVGLPDLVARVERAGYGIATGEADLVIKRLADTTMPAAWKRPWRSWKGCWRPRSA